ncbi:MAG: hypothetical protein NVS3B3_23840 [Aquirhabdus sp.]
MNRDELIRSVPVHEYKGRPFFIRVADIPDPWRTQFWKDITPCQCPAFEGEGDLAYVWDWERWVYGRSYASISSRMD